MASSNLNDKKPELADDKEKKVTIGNYISLILACVFLLRRLRYKPMVGHFRLHHNQRLLR